MKKYLPKAGLFCGFLMLAGPVFSQKYIADYSVAKESVLRSIPQQYLNTARTEFVIAYQHTSHGTHVSRGVFGLQDYKSGDNQLFAVSQTREAGKLDFRDNVLAAYAPPGVNAQDLSTDETAFIQTTRNFLDAPENAEVNVVMWSWCNIADHDVDINYLPGMEALISEYGQGGSKIGSGGGQRERAVDFIFMTGHANDYGNLGEKGAKAQAALINNYCNNHQLFCLDYYSIDTHAMDDTYYEDAGDDGNSSTYGGNFYQDWQDSHSLAEDWFENKESVGGSVAYGEHNSQHITANRKGYALWWILARLAGWGDGSSSVSQRMKSEEIRPYPNPSEGAFYLELPGANIEIIQVISALGSEVLTLSPSDRSGSIRLDMSAYAPGIYGIRLLSEQQTLYHGTILIQH